MSLPNSARLLFSGEKCFWNSNLSVELLFLEHSPLQIIEIIAYAAQLKYEAPHIYVDGLVLLAQMNEKGTIENREGGICRAKVDYLFDRIALSSYSHDFEVNVLSDFNHSRADDLIVVKPLELVEYKSPFVHVRRLAIPAPEAPVTMSTLSNQVGSYDLDSESPRAKTNDLVRSDELWTACTAGSGNGGVGATNLPRVSPSKLISTTDEDVAYGAPPRPLYGAGNVNSSANLVNPLGSPGNPRIVSRRRPSLTAPVHITHNAQPVAAVAPKVPTLLLTDTIVGAAQSSAVGSTNAASPRNTSPRFDADQVSASGGSRVVPMLRFLSSTLSTLGLFITSPRQAPEQQEQAQTLGSARSRCSNRDYEHSDDGCEAAGDTAGPFTDKKKPADVPVTPPSTARSITARHSITQLTAPAAEGSKPVRTNRTRQRRHTCQFATNADPTPSAAPTAVVQATVGSTTADVASATLADPSAVATEPAALAHASAQSGAQSPRTKPLAVRYALDNLRFPHWSGAGTGGGGGNKGKIIPSVATTATMDQQGLDACPP